MAQDCEFVDQKPDTDEEVLEESAYHTPARTSTLARLIVDTISLFALRTNCCQFLV